MPCMIIISLTQISMQKAFRIVIIKKAIATQSGLGSHQTVSVIMINLAVKTRMDLGLEIHKEGLADSNQIRVLCLADSPKQMVHNKL